MAYVVEDLDALKEKWAEEQRRLRAYLILSDPPWLAERLTSGHLLIGGLDVSFSKLLPDVAVATLAVIELNTLQMAHHVSLSVRMTVPYVPTFLGYREVGPFEQLVSMLKSECPDRLPDVFMIDGNGTLHPRGFGCACQFGLQLGVSAMGVAKNLLETEEHHPDSGRLKSNEKLSALRQLGDKVEITNADGQVCGLAVLNSPTSKRPVFLSPGHRISLTTACELVMRTSRFRNPEPTRMADQISKGQIRTLEQGGTIC